MSDYKVTNIVGTPTDYSDRNNWAYLPEKTDKEADTFFIYPTVYVNPEPGAPAIVPVEDEMLRAGVKAHFLNEGPQAFIDLTNLYEPYYRQSNLTTLGGDQREVLKNQCKEQRTDVYAALDYYFEHFNQGRPFFLAGHSQGSMMLKIALQDYFKEHTDYLERMVAAYVLGYSITTDDLAANPALKFAEGADDTGVIISWNVEGPENKHESNICVWENSLAINPLNWKRDETYAPASENKGDRIAIEKEGEFIPSEYERHQPGLADAQLDLERGVVVCTTLADRYLTPVLSGDFNPFGPASLHKCDYMAYWDNLRENIQTRIDAFLAK